MIPKSYVFLTPITKNQDRGWGKREGEVGPFAAIWRDDVAFECTKKRSDAISLNCRALSERRFSPGLCTKF